MQKIHKLFKEIEPYISIVSAIGGIGMVSLGGYFGWVAPLVNNLGKPLSVLIAATIAIWFCVGIKNFFGKKSKKPIIGKSEDTFIEFELVPMSNNGVKLNEIKRSNIKRILVYDKTNPTPDQVFMLFLLRFDKPISYSQTTTISCDGYGFNDLSVKCLSTDVDESLLCRDDLIEIAVGKKNLESFKRFKIYYKP